jgi:hypothetical protein
MVPLFGEHIDLNSSAFEVRSSSAHLGITMSDV